MSNATNNHEIEPSLPTNDTEFTVETGIMTPATHATSDSNNQPQDSSAVPERTETVHQPDQARQSTASADGASTTNTTVSESSPAGQETTGSNPRGHTPRPNSHLESWRFDTASSRFVPHVFDANAFGRPPSASSGPNAAQAGDTNTEEARIPEIILQTSTDISVHGPDGQQLPPEASQFLLRLLGMMGAVSNGANPMPGSASATFGVPPGSDTDASQSTTTTNMNPPPLPESATDGPEQVPHSPRSGSGFFDLLRELAMLRERSADPPPDTRRAKQLLRGLPVVSHGLIQRLQRVEMLKARELAQKQGASAKEVEGVDNKLLCLVCYEALLPETKATGDDDHDAVIEAKSDDMRVDDDEDDMDLDVPTDVSPSDSKPSLPLNPNSSDNSTTKPTPLASNANTTHRWPYQAPNALIALPCTHVFHATCLRPWFEAGKTTCPTCRFDIDPRSDSLDLADWLSPRRRRRQRERQQREREREQAANEEDINRERTGAAAMPSATSAVPDPSATAANDGNPLFNDPPSGMPPHLNHAIRQAMLSAISRALAGERPQSPPLAAATTPPQEDHGAPTSQTGPPLSGASNINAPSTTSHNGTMPPPQPGLPFDFLQGLSRLVPPGYSISSIIAGGSLDPPRGGNGPQPSSPTPSDAQHSNSAPPARAPSASTNPIDQAASSRPAPPRPSASTSWPPWPTRNGGRSPFLSAGLGPNGMSPVGPFSFFSSFGPSTPAQQPPTTPSTPATGGSSTSYLAAGSRPSTPSFRHHPYASSRPGFNQANSQAQPSAQASESRPSSANAGTDSNTGRPPNDEFRTTHTISLTFEIPLGIHLPHIGSRDPDDGPSSAPQNGFNPADTEIRDRPQPRTQASGPGAIPPFAFPPGIVFGNGIPIGAPFGIPFGPAPFFNSFDGLAGFSAGAGVGTDGSRGGSSRERRQKKKWSAPEGSSLRSVVEAKEREVGLRCDDISCLFGPEDEDEEPVDGALGTGIRSERVFLKKSSTLSRPDQGDRSMTTEEPACVHRLHPECLLVSSRIADPFLNDAIDTTDENETLEAACPICRTRGVLSVSEWRRCKRLTDQL